MHPMLSIAVRAARRAGAIITQALDQRHALKIESKSENDFVSEVDRNAEFAIIEILQRAYPDHAILGEESGQHEGNEYEWIIDPLDGTFNFLKGNPQFCVSIALQHNSVLTHAVIYDPLRDELYTATKGNGAYLNNHRIRVGRATGLQGTLIGTGFPFRMHQHIDAYLGMFKNVLSQAADIRRPGSAALDLAFVACGRLDGFWEMGLHPWDMAAGVLLIQEAGGLVGDFRGGHDFLKTGQIVVGNPRVFKGLLQAIQPQVAEVLSKKIE